MKIRYLLIILIIAILVVIGISWFVFNWQPARGGILLLVVAAVISVVSFINNLISLIKNWSSLGRSPAQLEQKSQIPVQPKPESPKKEKIKRAAESLEKAKIFPPPQRRAWPFRKKDDNSHPLVRLRGRKFVFDPFLWERAEDDEHWLFLREKPFFWWDLPQIQRLSDSPSVFSFVVGESGSGKSALAMALGLYAPSPYTLGIHRQGNPDLENIYSALAEKLMEFLRFHPTYLGYLEDSERDLLADVFLRYISVLALRAEIERLSHSENWDWLLQAADEEQKERWQADAIDQLGLLQRSLDKHPDAKILPEQEWPRAFHQVCQALRFQKITVTIDANSQTEPVWIQHLHKQIVNIWSLAGLQAFIFLPEDVISQCQSKGIHLEKVAPVERLCWVDADRNYLRDMIDYRWSTLNTQLTIDAFTEGRIDELIDQANGNPGAFVRHWKAFVAARRLDRKG